MKKPVNVHVEVDLLIAEPASDINSVDFVEVCEKNGSTFFTDKNFGIAKISWKGHVDIHIAKKLIRLGFEAIEFHGYKKLILDHSELAVFETEARVWIKELLKHKAERVNEKLIKLASISPKNAIGSVYSNFAGDIIKEEMPHLKMRKFDDVSDALHWLI
ncbi:hypothetical protein [Ekhidna sp. To15]|uniref:hypothetical protein n=1 Tax=Ekhidna sp. To15 TaxID=3395267 RepID=UPI003F525147